MIQKIDQVRVRERIYRSGGGIAYIVFFQGCITEPTKLPPQIQLNFL